MTPTKSRSVANFDVGVLFYNRFRQTLDCILSFLDDAIQPSIVVLDQGSAAEQRELLTDALIHQPNVRLITLAKNIGVGPGRNRISRECTSDWILFVDNDTVLNTPGGVGLINSALERVEDVDGYSPRILNVHENRLMDRLRITEQDRLLRFEVVDPDVPITNMFSGCAAVMRRSILVDEPYDERYFVGFEDFEMALRAFTLHKPMRVKSLDNVTLVHKHMPVISDPDVASTRMRYSSLHLAKSFDAIKAQYHEDMFRGWELWASKQQEEMIASRRIASRSIHDKVKLTFVVDAPNSASGSIVRNLNQYISATHVLTAVFTHAIDDPGITLQQIIESRPDVIHFMWRSDFQKYVCTAAISKGAALMRLNESELLDSLCQSHITFSVGDFLFLDQEEITSLRPLYWLSDGYCVTSPRLFDIYERMSDYPNPSALILDGVDANHWASSVPLWQHFFEDVIRKAHPDAANWRRFMIDKFFLSAGVPQGGLCDGMLSGRVMDSFHEL